ncbi:CoA transferase [Yinghuangia sp. ASG 101]|uniref:CoA transferase n=1 Tax=Yinghuangia sp. ASG 101 TaxID=2896848 RepID=UPI003FCD819B
MGGGPCTRSWYRPDRGPKPGLTGRSCPRGRPTHRAPRAGALDAAHLPTAPASSADGHVLFMASERKFWRNFCAAIGRDELFHAHPGAELADHARGNLTLRREPASVFRTRTTAEWVGLGLARDLPICPVNTPASIATAPQFTDRLPWQPAERQVADQLPFRSGWSARLRPRRPGVRRSRASRRRRSCAMCSAATRHGARNSAGPAPSAADAARPRVPPGAGSRGTTPETAVSHVNTRDAGYSRLGVWRAVAFVIPAAASPPCQLSETTSRSRSSFFRTLPAALTGRSSTMCTWRGTL